MECRGGVRFDARSPHSLASAKRPKLSDDGVFPLVTRRYWAFIHALYRVPRRQYELPCCDITVIYHKVSMGILDEVKGGI